MRVPVVVVVVIN